MFLIALAIILATVLIFKGVKIFNYIDHVAGIMEMIPGPTPYPFVGNLFQFGLKPAEYPKKILQYCRKYDFQGFRSLALFQYHIMLSDPADIQSILASSTLLYKEHLYSFLRPWLGDGLLTSSGARWLKHQKLYLPAFERVAVDGYLRVVHSTSEKLLQKLAKVAEANEVFDAQEVVAKCTLDIVCENATGIAGYALNDEPSALHSAVKDLCNVIQKRTFSIVKRFDTLFQLTSYYWKQRQALQLLRHEVNSLVVRRRQQLALSQASGSKATAQSFLDVLLKAKLDGRALTQQDILEELSTFIFTGHDPMAASISFTLYTLSRHAHIQAKCFAEQQRVYGVSAASQEEAAAVDCARLERLTYLESVIRETLRLYPAVPLIARTNRQPIDINGTKIAKRTTIIMCLIAMGYNERYFDAPCEFRPERFTHAATGGIEAYKSVPFSAGPRRCIAEVYAMQQLKLILGKIIRNFELLPPVEGLSSGINDHTRVACVPQSTFDPVLNIRVTLRSENGIQLRLRKR